MSDPATTKASASAEALRQIILDLGLDQIEVDLLDLHNASAERLRYALHHIGQAEADKPVLSQDAALAELRDALSNPPGPYADGVVTYLVTDVMSPALERSKLGDEAAACIRNAQASMARSMLQALTLGMKLELSREDHQLIDAAEPSRINWAIKRLGAAVQPPRSMKQIRLDTLRAALCGLRLPA